MGKEIDKKLYIEGVNSQGFGIIYKALTTDGTIPLQSKAIYSYIASFAGSSGSAFPGTKKIMSDLKFSHSSYFYKYLNILIDNGFLKINKIRNGANNYLRNEYILTVKKDEKIDIKESSTDKLLIDGFAAMGYGTVPKKVMVDDSLSMQAKAIYAYFCSYSGAGNSCIPSQKLICKQLKVTVNTLVKYLKELEGANYIEIIKNTSPTGQTLITQYILIEKPVVSVTQRQASSEQHLIEDEGGIKNEPTVFGPIDFGPTVFEPTNNNSINSNSVNNNRNNNIKSSSDNVYENIKEMMINKFSYTCLNTQMYISDVIKDNTGLIDYLTVYNEITANAPAAGENKLCSRETARERALAIAQALSVLYRDKKISLDEIKDLEYIYSKSRETKVSNPIKYIQAIIKKESSLY